MWTLRPGWCSWCRFNGAMAFQPWILGAGHCGDCGGDVSMGPWPFSHGYVYAHGMEFMNERVSMGPWLFSHGYGVLRYRSSIWQMGFNGAMAFQPWIQEICKTEESKSTCFNGAMAFQPWIRYFEAISFARGSYSAATLPVNAYSSPSTSPGLCRDTGLIHGNLRALLLGHSVTGALATVLAHAVWRPVPFGRVHTRQKLQVVWGCRTSIPSETYWTESSKSGQRGISSWVISNCASAAPISV